MLLPMRRRVLPLLYPYASSGLRHPTGRMENKKGLRHADLCALQDGLEPTTP